MLYAKYTLGDFCSKFHKNHEKNIEIKWENEIINVTSVGQTKKSDSRQDSNDDLPNIGRALYPLSYRELMESVLGSCDTRPTYC